jgi:hypothetical protein
MLIGYSGKRVYKAIGGMIGQYLGRDPTHLAKFELIFIEGSEKPLKGFNLGYNKRRLSNNICHVVGRKTQVVIYHVIIRYAFLPNLRESFGYFRRDRIQQMGMQHMSVRVSDNEASAFLYPVCRNDYRTPCYLRACRLDDLENATQTKRG